MLAKRVIAVLLLMLYTTSAVANALGVLSCDCASHHRHDLCCAAVDDDHHSDRAASCGHRHDLCSAFCDTEECAAAISGRCECRHRHSEMTAFTVECDNDYILRYIKVYAVGTECMLCEAEAEADADSDRLFRLVADKPLALPPVIPARAPRAPSVRA